MCYKYVRLAGAILISSLIISESMANVQIGGVIDIGKDLSYKYKVILPEQKDNSTPKITEWTLIKERGQMEKQSKVQEELQMSNQTYKRMVTSKQPTTKQEEFRIKENSRKHATPVFSTAYQHVTGQQLETKKHSEEQKKSQVQEQLKIIKNSRKHETVSPYFSSINERLLKQQSPKQTHSEEQFEENVQLRLEEQQMQEQFQNDKRLKVQDGSNPYFKPVESQQQRMKIQSEEFELSQLQENLRIHDKSSSHYNHKFDRVADQQNQQQIKKTSEEQDQSQERKPSQSQEQQQMHERSQIDKISRMQDKSNPYFNLMNERVISQQQQIKKQSEENLQSREFQQSQLEEQQQIPERLQEQQQISERSQSDKNLPSQADTLNLYVNSANEQLVESHHVKTQSTENDRSQELRQRQLQDQQHLQELLREQQELQERLKEQQQMQERIQEQQELQERTQGQQQTQEQTQKQQQMYERFESEKNVRSQDTSNLYSNTGNEHLIGQQIQNQTEERSLTQEVIQLPLEEQQQAEEQFRNNNNARPQDTQNSYFNPTNEHIVDHQQLINKQSVEQQQSEEHLLQQKQMKERFHSDNNPQTQDTSRPNINPADEGLQQQMAKQSEEQRDSQEHKQYQFQEQQQIQERYERLHNDNKPQAQDTSNQNFNPRDEQPKDFQQQMIKHFQEQEHTQEHREFQYQDQQWMQEQFQSDRSPLPQDTSHPYSNSLNERLVQQQQQQMKNQSEELVSYEERKQASLQEQQQIQRPFPNEKNLRTQDTSNAYLSPENKGQVDKQQMLKVQAEDQEQPQENKQTKLQEKPHIQVQFQNNKNAQSQDKSTTQQPQTKHSKNHEQLHSPKELKMQNIFEIDKNLRSKDESHVYFNTNEKPLGYPEQIEKQSEEREQSKEHKRSRLQTQPQMQEQFQVDKNYRVNEPRNQSVIMQKPQMKTRFDEQDQSQEYDQDLPKKQGLFGIDINLEIQDSPNKNLYPLNKRPADKLSQMEEQSEAHSRSHEHFQRHEGSWIPRPPKQGLFSFHDQSRSVEMPNPHPNVKLHENLQSHKTANPIKTHLKDGLSSRYQQSGIREQSREQGPHIQGNYHINDPTQELKQRAEQFQMVKQQIMQGISLSVIQTTQNPYIISVNKRIEEERLQLKETNKPTTHQQSLTTKTLNPFVSSVIKLLSDKISQIQNQSKIQDQSPENKQLNTGKKSEQQDSLPPQEQLQDQYQFHMKQLSQIHNPSQTHEILQVQRSRIQGTSHNEDKTPNPYFYSVNKRLSEEQSKSKGPSQIHENLQTPHTYSNMANKHQSVGQPEVQERLQYYRHIKTHATWSTTRPHGEQKTLNPYFKSINKRLEDEQSKTQAPLHIEKTISQHIHSVNKRITVEFGHEDMQKSSHKEVTTNRYINSINNRFTVTEHDGERPRDKHKHLEATPNPHFQSVNKRLTTGETDDRYYEKDRSDYDQFAPEWFETSSTTKRKRKHRHHHRDSQSDSEYSESREQRNVKGTVFEDLTIRKRKPRKSTTISHMHSHRQYKTTLKYDNVDTEKILATKLIQNENHTTWDPFIEFQHRETIKAIDLKKSQISKTYANAFTLKAYNSNPLNQRTNITKKNHLRNKIQPAQQVNNTISALKIRNVPKYNKLVTQIVTNLTFNDIFGHPKKIKYDTQIKTFTTHILQSGLNVFATLKDKATDYAIKNKIDELSEKYEAKFKEFLTDTCRHEIKTSLGKQKVILNAIDVSDRILKRLMNFEVAEMDQKGNLRDNMATVLNFQQEVDKETNLQFNHICQKFGICRTGNGFPNFLVEYLTIILRCDDAKFKLAMDSLTESTKNMDLSNSFQKKTRQMIKNTVNRLELLDVKTLRPAFMIVKNIIANKNRPLVVSRSESHSGRINSTLALLEIVDIFEEKLPRTDANIINWGDLRTNLDEWSQDRRSDVVTTMETFVNYLKSAVETMPYEVREHIAKNLERVINVY